jgi:hypothetical protein
MILDRSPVRGTPRTGEMSDTSQGPGWWLASDGKWYPPETHPAYEPIPRARPRSNANPSDARPMLDPCQYDSRCVTTTIRR